MKLFIRIFLIALTILTMPLVNAKDLRAVTEDGRKVVLSSDGKWQFDKHGATLSPVTSDTASPYHPAVKKFSIAFNTKYWDIEPHSNSDSSNKRRFKHNSLPIYAMVISDGLPTTTPVMKNVIIANAQSVATPTILLDQPISISGKEAGAIRFSATMNGIDFLFSTYYYGDEDGNIQVSCFTGQAIFFKYESDCQQFLESFSIK